MGFPPVLALFNVGNAEIMIIVLIIMLLFGASKIPELARSLGRAQREFQKARSEVERDVKSPPPKKEERKAPTYTAPGVSGDASSTSEEAKEASSEDAPAKDDSSS